MHQNRGRARNLFLGYEKDKNEMDLYIYIHIYIYIYIIERMNMSWEEIYLLDHIFVSFFIRLLFHSDYFDVYEGNDYN